MKRNEMFIEKIKQFTAKPETETRENTGKKLKRIVSSVVIAIIVWFVIINIVNPEISVWMNDIPVRFIGENSLRDKGLVLVSKNELPDFAVKVKGNRGDLMDGMDNIRIDIDLSKIDSMGEVTVYPSVNMPNYITLEKQRFSTAELNVEPLFTKFVPVVVKQVGEEKLKDKIVRSVPATEEIRISGSQADTDKAAYCVVTVDVSSGENNSTVVSSYTITDADGVALGEDNTLYAERATVSVTNTVYDRYKVPVKIQIDEALRDKYIIKLDEKSISQTEAFIGVSDDTDVPDKLTAVLEDGEYESGIISLTLEAPEGVYVKEQFITANIQFTKRTEITETVNVEIVNIPAGLQTEKTTVSHRMKLSVPEGTDMTKVKVTADAVGAFAGFCTLKLKIDNEDIDILSGDEIQVSFNTK